jgi:hypothetical protein
MKRTIEQRSARRRVGAGLATLVVGLLALAVAGSAQPAQGELEARVPSAPRIGAIMLAYEAVRTNKRGPDSRITETLRRELGRSPGARRMFAKWYASYRQLSPEERRTMLGPLASFSADTALPRDVLRRVLLRGGSPILSAAQFPRNPRGEKGPSGTPRNPSEPGTLEAKDPNRIRHKDGVQLGVQPPTALSGKFKKYRVAYKGMYLTDSDESPAEPYVQFILSEANEVWTNRVGPYSIEPSGEPGSSGTSKRDRTLRSNTDFVKPLSVIAIGWENDGSNPDDVAAATNVIVTVVCAIASSEGYPCPPVLTGWAKDLANWLVGLIDPDDLVGFSFFQMTAGDAFTKNWSDSTTGEDSGLVRDFLLLFDGSGYRYWVAIDAVPLD